MWVKQYIGIPYKSYSSTRSGCDCWGLVQLIYKEMLGIDISPLMGMYHTKKMDAYNIEVQKWNKVSTYKQHDVLVFKYGRYIDHVGIVIDDKVFLHVEDRAMACIDNYKTGVYERVLEAGYRYGHD